MDAMRINRNILECKFLCSLCHQVKRLVLIETYWNVNSIFYWSGRQSRGVLIETYWNVNVIEWMLKGIKGYVLIETYWNVNERASVSSIC